MSFNIAIDGPAGAGKSTIAKLVAKTLGFIYVDTGAMYRSIALFFLRNQVDITNEEQVTEALGKIKITIEYIDGTQHVFLNGEDVSKLIRNEEVGNMASKSAALPPVRGKLLELQRDLASNFDVVMDGRDIGTNILPHAQVKVYLTASVEERASRRYKELCEKNMICDLEEIKKDIEQRDYQDMNREIAPLCKAEDAHLLDSSDLTIDEVTQKIISFVQR